jgi:hypothetical protein
VESARCVGRHDVNGILNVGQSPQMSMDAAEPALDNLAHVGQQMLPVCGLDRSGRSHSDATGIFGRTVACDDLDPWTLPEPSGQRGRAAVRHQGAQRSRAIQCLCKSP